MDAKFHEQLLAFDRDLAATAREAGCPCGGRLHASHYERKPRGQQVVLDAEHCCRFSYCCAVDGCRSRMTPVSLRFLGRKVYLGAVVTLISAVREGLTERRQETLAAIGVDRRTVARWRRWWLDWFTATPFWRLASAALLPPADPARLPASLLERFVGSAEERLISFLRFLAPITTGAMRHAV
jgi:hypothetical protein